MAPLFANHYTDSHVLETGQPNFYKRIQMFCQFTWDVTFKRQCYFLLTLIKDGVGWCVTPHTCFPRGTYSFDKLSSTYIQCPGPPWVLLCFLFKEPFFIFHKIFRWMQWLNESCHWNSYTPPQKKNYLEI